MALQIDVPLQYRCIGPSRGGRVTAVSGVPGQAGIFYMGATGGGLWKTNDYGIHWKNISDGYFATPSIGAIAVGENNPDIVYVGTGSDAIRSNVIVGKGVYKSKDAGNTWIFCGLENAGQIGSILIHPENSDKVYVAVIGQPFRKSEMRGIYQTLDGGTTWKNIFFLSDSVGALDLEFSPGNPDIIYATMWRAERKPWTIISGGAEDGIYKTTDGGLTWEKKTAGLPKGLVGKIDLAVSADMPARVWAQVQASGGEEGLYRSDDFGETWTRVEMPAETHKSIMYRPFYFTNLTADPNDADRIWAGTKIFWNSKDGGKTWSKVPVTHSDHHDLWIDPTDSEIMIEGNDGGAAISRDGGKNWSTLFNQPTAELYSCDVDDQYPYYLYSGQQDNSSIRVPSRRPYLDVLTSNDNHGLNELMYWEDMGGCETGPVVPKPGNPDIIYANCKGQFTLYNVNLGIEHHYYVGAESLYGNHPDDITYRFQRVTPIEVSPHNPDLVYYGSQYVHRTVNGGKEWQTISPDLTANREEYRMRSGGPIDEDISGEEYYAVLYAIEESPIEKGVIWTGSNDGLFYITRDGGQTWKNVTPVMPEGGRVSNIEASPHNPARAFYALYRDYLGDDRPYIYATDNYGESWTLLTNGKNGIPPDFPTRIVREDTQREGLLFAGTEFGIYFSVNKGRQWHSLQRNLPVVPVTDIRIIRDDLALSTLGRSFWILDDISALRYIDENDNSSFKLFKPRNTTGYEQRIFFTLPDDMSDKRISLEILKGDNSVIKDDFNIADLIADDLGFYMVRWDLHHYLKEGNECIEGPFVSPGEYTVRLNCNGQTLEESFQYLINPELEDHGTSENDLVEQEELALEVARLCIEIRKEISITKEEIEKTKNKKKVEYLKKKLSLLEKGPARYDQPMLIDHAEYLLEMISHTPQKVGRDAFERYSVLKGQFEKLKESK